MDLLLHRVVVTQTNLNSLTENRQGKISEQTTRFCANFERAVAFWFSALLRMVVLHRSAFRMPAMGAKLSNLPEQTRLLISIFCISLSRHSGHILPFLPAADYFPRPIPSTDGPSCLGILMQTHALDVAASMIDTVPDEARHQCAHFLKEKCPLFAKFQNDPRFAYLLGPITDPQPSFFPQPPSLPSPAASGSIPAPTPGNATNASQPIATSEGPNSDSGNLRIQYRGRIVGPCPLRPWELLEDAAPIVGTNDTAISLSYFDARRVRA